MQRNYLFVDEKMIINEMYVESVESEWVSGMTAKE